MPVSCLSSTVGSTLLTCSPVDREKNKTKHKEHNNRFKCKTNNLHPNLVVNDQMYQNEIATVYRWEGGWTGK